MSLAEVLAGDRRLNLLQALAEANPSHLNEMVLRQALAGVGHETSRDLVRADLIFLCEHGLAKREEIEAANGRLWLMTLTDEGALVAKGKRHPGVAVAGPK